MEGQKNGMTQESKGNTTGGRRMEGQKDERAEGWKGRWMGGQKDRRAE